MMSQWSSSCLIGAHIKSYSVLSRPRYWLAASTDQPRLNKQEIDEAEQMRIALSAALKADVMDDSLRTIEVQNWINHHLLPSKRR